MPASKPPAMAKIEVSGKIKINSGGEVVNHQYRCEKCGHVSDRPGSCCGQPMKEIS